MPTYGYRCTACGYEFEKFQKMTDAPLTECESCGGTVKKRIYPVGVQFVGSGFYINDYARQGNSSQSSAGKTEAAETKPAESPSAESKSSSDSTPATAGSTASAGNTANPGS